METPEHIAKRFADSLKPRFATIFHEQAEEEHEVFWSKVFSCLVDEFFGKIFVESSRGTTYFNL